MDFQTFCQVITHIRQKMAVDHALSVIYLSGGEPLLHPDFFNMLDFCFTQFERISILTNGILIPRYIEQLSHYPNSLAVQVSLDGDIQVNDFLRGRGVYQKVIEALNSLDEHHIPHWISYTVSKLNGHCYKDILNIAEQTHSLFNNVTPYTGDPQIMLSYIEWKEFKYRFEKYAAQLHLSPAHGPDCCGFSYRCGAFHSGVTINPDGALAGCARLNNIKGHYSQMEKFIETEPLSIAETCMKAKWGQLQSFELLRRLE